MKNLLRNCKNSLPILIGLIVIISLSCARDEKYIGTYRPTKDNPPIVADLCVEFHKGGTGIRRFRGEDIAFEWELKGNEIRIHTKNGGILIAKMHKGILHVSLPGGKTIHLKKSD